MADVADVGRGCCFSACSRGVVVGMTSVDPDLLSDGAEEASEPVTKKGGGRSRTRIRVATVGYGGHLICVPDHQNEPCHSASVMYLG